MRDRIREGMTAYSSDGEKLGKVIAIGDTEIYVEKGFFFPKDTVFLLSEVQSVEGDRLIISSGREALTSRGYEGTDRTERTAGEVRVPLAEEELDVVKRERAAGDVKVHKTVHTETRTVDVPIRTEHVDVERVPASRASSGPADTAFQDETITVPVMEEEVEVRKIPKVREEVRINKSEDRSERRVAETVRKEEAEITDDRERPGFGSPDYDPYNRS